MNDVERLEKRIDRVEADLKDEIHEMRRESNDFRNKMPEIIREAVYQRSGDRVHKNGNGNSNGPWQIAVFVLCFGMMGGGLGFVAHNQIRHESIGSHKVAGETLSNHDARIHALEGKYRQIDSKTENFSKERKNITENTIDIAKNDERISSIDKELKRIDHLFNVSDYWEKEIGTGNIKNQAALNERINAIENMVKQKFFNEGMSAGKYKEKIEWLEQQVIERRHNG
jgi:hypothetical protein